MYASYKEERGKVLAESAKVQDIRKEKVNDAAKHREELDRVQVIAEEQRNGMQERINRLKNIIDNQETQVKEQKETQIASEMPWAQARRILENRADYKEMTCESLRKTIDPNHVDISKDIQKRID
jgi:hypothetical protein